MIRRLLSASIRNDCDRGPKMSYPPAKKSIATVSALLSTSCMTSGHRVNRLTQVNKYLKPFEYGKGPTMSICTWSNLSVGSVNLPKNGFIMTWDLGGLTTFARSASICVIYIHTVPDEVCIKMSYPPAKKSIHHNERFRSSMWRSSKTMRRLVKTFLQNLAVMYGLAISTIVREKNI